MKLLLLIPYTEQTIPKSWTLGTRAANRQRVTCVGALQVTTQVQTDTTTRICRQSQAKHSEARQWGVQCTLLHSSSSSPSIYSIYLSTNPEQVSLPPIQSHLHPFAELRAEDQTGKSGVVQGEPYYPLRRDRDLDARHHPVRLSAADSTKMMMILNCSLFRLDAPKGLKKELQEVQRIKPQFKKESALLLGSCGWNWAGFFSLPNILGWYKKIVTTMMKKCVSTEICT